MPKIIVSALSPYTLIYIVMWQIEVFCISINSKSSGTWDKKLCMLVGIKSRNTF